METISAISDSITALAAVGALVYGTKIWKDQKRSERDIDVNRNMIRAVSMMWQRLEGFQDLCNATWFSLFNPIWNGDKPESAAVDRIRNDIKFLISDIDPLIDQFSMAVREAEVVWGRDLRQFEIEVRTEIMQMIETFNKVLSLISSYEELPKIDSEASQNIVDRIGSDLNVHLAMIESSFVKLERIEEEAFHRWEKCYRSKSSPYPNRQHGLSKRHHGMPQSMLFTMPFDPQTMMVQHESPSDESDPQ